MNQMNVSYLTQLREQITETKKRADPPLPSDTLIILRVSRTPKFKRGSWETQINAIFQDEGWNQGGVAPPSLVFVLDEEAHFYFPYPKSSMNILISTASSVCTKVDMLSPKVYQCAAFHLTNVAEALAYFVLETDKVERIQAEILLGTPLDHMTEKEFRDTLSNSQVQFDYSKTGVFYRNWKPNTTILEGWKSFDDGKNTVIKLSKSLSFDTFEENISLLFNRS